jgi:hypothetical protein
MAETVARVSWGKCLVCGAAGTAGELKRCSGCRNDGIEYCGKACQAVDWKVHSKVCVQPRGLDGLTPFELVDGARAHEAVAKTNEGGRPAMAAGKEASSPAAKAHRTVLVLLHGLGDEASNFVEFGRKMELPGTRVVAVCAPLPLPYVTTSAIPNSPGHSDSQPPSLCPPLRLFKQRTRGGHRSFRLHVHQHASDQWHSLSGVLSTDVRVCVCVDVYSPTETHIAGTIQGMECQVNAGF